jgi:colicin import membrane protein
MKAGLSSSLVLHGVLLAMAVVSMSAPASMQVADIQAMPIDIIPIEELTQIQEGAKDAPKTEKAAPKPTSRPDVVANAQKTGENKQDLKNDPVPDAPEKPIEKTTEPPAKATPTPAPVRPEPKPATPETKPVSEPTPEVAPEPKPQQDVKPEPKPEAKPEPKPEPSDADKIEAEIAKADKAAAEQAVAEKAEAQKAAAAKAKADAKKAEAKKLADAKKAEAKKLADAKAKAEKQAADKEAAAKAQSATTPNRKAETSQKAAKKPASDAESDSLENDIAALLNKEKAAGGGAKKSTDQASLGGKKTTGGAKLSASEMDALRQQIQACWNPPFGVDEAMDLKVQVQIKLTLSGEVEGAPQIKSSGGSGVQRAAAEAARRAVLSCAPYNLPADKYDTWQDVVVNFDPQDLFR